jgi:methyl-accepting chemotaxis protein
MKSTWSLRTKLVTIFLAIGLIPLLITMGISYNSAKKEIYNQAAARVEMLAADKGHQIEAYFSKELEGLVDLAQSSIVTGAINQFTDAMNTYKTTPPSREEYAIVEEFYKSTFADEYLKKNPGEKFSASDYMADLDQISISAQYDFIANNANPLGQKNNLNAALRPVPYNVAHSRVHPELNAFLGRHGLYDIFLVSPAGRVVYTVFKETDFSTDLTRGKLANSGLGRAFKNSLSLKAGEVYVEDFDRYAPSYEAPASFVATPIIVDGKFLGSLLIQLPLDKITAVASSRYGLGELGQVLLIGQDGRLRADAFRQKEKYSVAESFKRNSQIQLTSEEIKLALAGKSGITETTSYDGTEVIASYQPIKVANVTWAVVSELSEKELFSGLNQLKLFFITILVLGASVVIATAWLVSRSIINKQLTIISSLGTSSKKVSSASGAAEASATTLSEAATEQAASLQETMASAEEISAMIDQNAESAAKAKHTVENNDQATKDGSKAVVEMVAAIGEIKTTNQQILEQMELSNKEFGEIVQIISEIGDKTKVINDIVFQTKLLSFNASVEAARAGEHGKGFAVVAEEVGNLAQMSGNAAKEISDMLSASIKRVNSIVDQTKVKVEQLVEIGKDKVTMGQNTAERCRAALENLSKNAATLTAMVTEIAHASKEQAQGVKEINTAISQLDKVTQQNSAVAQQSSAQAESLLNETEQLDSAVNQLILFVGGGKALADKSRLTNDVKHQDSAPLKAAVSINSYKKKTASVRKDAPAATNEIKMASGSDVAPGNNHPGFEDF